ncbi:MAG TPA: hypothetical protein VEA41_03335 [Salinarimonas sp.]|jgi:hypothetical protein|nr:hypothetical protein [Salinarimonas sp.]
MQPQHLTWLAFALAGAGLACFLAPVVRRLRGGPPQAAGAAIRSPLWWTGFVLTAIAIVLQRMAAGGA